VGREVKKIIPQTAVLIPDEAKRVFRGVIYDVYHWQQQLFDGTDATFEMLKRHDTVGAICIVDDKLLVLTDEQPHRGIKMTFPGGRLNDGEDTLQAVRREVHEETGYSFKNFRLLKVRQPHTKIEWFVYTYIAWGLEGKAAAHLDGGERIKVDLKSFSDVKKMVIEDKAGYLAEEEVLFEGAQSVQDLLAIPEYEGHEVDR
jgi:ADP-ribose pyrophosphatase